MITEIAYRNQPYLLRPVSKITVSIILPDLSNIYIYIYIYIERERERANGRK
jgi:hypothetical protein